MGRSGRGRANYLFAEGDLRSMLANRRRQLEEVAQAITAERAVGRSVEELAAELASEYTRELIEVDWEAKTASYADAQVDVSRNFDRVIIDRNRPFHVAGTTITYHIPFRGEPGLFKATPSTYSSVFPVGTVGASELTISATFP